ncbi:MAG: hypothetical protein IPK79_12505 [Vampirovibrionales bacterium]|nr:hypothetical protein [Vampirovibrionales bacterium]
MSASDSLLAHELLEKLTSGAVIAETESGRVFYVNPALLAFLGYPDSAAIPAKGDALTLRDILAFSKAASEKDLSLINPVLDGFLHTARNEEFRVKIKPSPLTDVLTLSLVDPYSEEQAISQAHSDFVSVVSHEFRTPLTSIKGFADTLLRYGQKLPPDQQTRFVTIIKDQADRLTRMVENLLTASKLGSGKVELAYRAIPLEKMVEKVIQNILAKANQDKVYENRKVHVDIAPSLPDVWADTDKLEQVLTNLIDNALKYSFPESDVRVKGLCDPADDDAILIRIINQGMGIPAESLAKIFTKFSRVDNPLTRQREGTGLGLYITKTMVTSMGGRIQVESVPDEETTFSLRFLAATPERQAAYHQSMGAHDAGAD